MPSRSDGFKRRVCARLSSWTLASLVAFVCTLARADAADVDTVHAHRIHVDGVHFKDERGAVVLLRGLNVAGDAKVPPFRPLRDPSVLDRLPALGVNVARLLFIWEAFEPEREHHDESYLAYYAGVIDALAARGIAVIIDVHQDAFSRFALHGCGEGMPAWAVSSAVARDAPDNGSGCSWWGLLSMVDRDTRRSWEDFYANVRGVRSRYLALLKVLAERFGDHPAVIGYDLLNEPWGDERAQIAPLYEAGARVIRAVDADALLFLSPQALTSAGQASELARPSFGNLVYAPHYYDPLVALASIWWGDSLEAPVNVMLQHATRWGAPLFVGEFGAPAHTVNGPAYMDAFYAALDRRFVSAAQWSFVAHWSEQRKDGWNAEDYSIFDASFALRANYRVRPYPARIPGEPRTFEVTREPAPELELSWTHDPKLGELRIFAPRTLFVGGVRVEATGDLACQLERGGLHVRCTSQEAGPRRVRLAPCAAGGGCLRDDGMSKAELVPQATALYRKRSHREGWQTKPAAKWGAAAALFAGVLAALLLRRRTRPARR